MTRAKISEYSATAGDNTDVNGINIAEGCPPSSMNNMGREIMAALKRFQVGSDGDGVTVGGSLVVSGSTTVNTFNVDVISEKTSAAGVTVDGVLLKDSQVSTDQINEKTSATGVTIDGVLLKDSGVVTGAGTVSAPVYSTTGDLNTGIFFPAADTIAFAEGGAEAMRITSDGRLGIGTTSPTSGCLLDVKGGDIRAENTSGAIRVRLVGGSNQYSLETSSTTNALQFIDAQAGSERARITSGGALLVGTTTAAATAKVEAYKTGASTTCFLATQGDSGDYCYTSRAANNSGVFYHFNFTEAGTQRGSITSNGSATAYNTGSDYRLKDNIAPLTGALSTVLQLQPRVWTWKTNGSDGQGFIAHELAEVVPDCVTGEKDAVETYTDEEGVEQTRPVYQGVDTSFLVATLTAAIQELKAINDAQASRIETLEAKVAALEAQPNSSGE